MAVLVVAKDKIVLEGDRLSSEEYNIEVVGRCQGMSFVDGFEESAGLSCNDCQDRLSVEGFVQELWNCRNP